MGSSLPVYLHERSSGVIRPDSAGRSFLALLHCSEEGLTASRFGEYLSHEQKEQRYGWERLLVDAAVT